MGNKRSYSEVATITTLTPDAARRLLANNTHNRPLRSKLVSKLAKIIDEKRWKFNGASIVVDKKGRLLDGQHRLHAIVRADKSVRTVLVTGVNPAAFDTIDQGAKRTGSDIFNLCGVRNASVVAAAINIICQNRRNIPEGSSAGHASAEMDERIKMFDLLPTFEDDVAYVVRYSKELSGIVSLSMMAGMYYLFKEKSVPAARAFLAELAHGKSKDDSPPAILRQQMIALSEEDYRIGRQARAAYLKVAWNAFVSGEAPSRIDLPKSLDIKILRKTSDLWMT